MPDFPLPLTPAESRVFLALRPDWMRTADVVTAAKVSKATASRALVRLAHAGMVVRSETARGGIFYWRPADSEAL